MDFFKNFSALRQFAYEYHPYSTPVLCQLFFLSYTLGGIAYPNQIGSLEWVKNVFKSYML